MFLPLRPHRKHRPVRDLLPWETLGRSALDRRLLRGLAGRGGSFALAGGIGLFGLSLLPLRVEIADQISVSHPETGIVVHARHVTGGWRPWDDVVLHDAEIRVPVAEGAPIRAHASKIRVSGLRLVLRDEDPFEQVEKIEVRDLETEIGGVRIVHGSLALRRESGRLRIEGQGAASSGYVDVRGELSARAPYTGRVRLYLDALRVPLPDPIGVADLSGVVALERRGERSDLTEVTLEAVSPRESGAPPWLVAALAGTLERVAGRWTPEGGLEVRGAVRDVRGESRLWAVHGPFRGSLTLRGPLERTEGRLRLDLADVRIRAGDGFDKPAGVPASARLTARLRRGTPVLAEGRIRLAGLRARVEAEREAGWSWGIETGWWPVADVRARVPALADEQIDGGEVRLRLRGTSAETVAAELEVRDLGLVDGLIRVPGAVLRVDGGRARLAPTALELGGQHVTVSGELHREDAGGWELGLEAAAPRIDVEPILHALPQEIGPEGPPGDSEQTAEATVRWLHTHSYLLRDFDLRPVRLEIDALYGDGIPEQPLSVDGTLEDRLIRLKLSEREGDEDPHEICLDLKHWRPRLHRARPDTDRCSQASPVSLGG